MQRHAALAFSGPLARPVQQQHRHVARLDEAAIGVVTGEVGAGKTVAVRADIAELDTSRHTLIYLGNPAVGARGIYTSIVTRLGGVLSKEDVARPYQLVAECERREGVVLVGLAQEKMGDSSASSGSQTRPAGGSGTRAAGGRGSGPF